MNPKMFASDKILHHLERIQSWKRGENPFAVTVEIDPANVCNHRCPGCFGFAKDSKESLDKDLMFSFIDQIVQLKAKGLTFTGGGEPLCNSSTELAIGYAQKKGLHVGLITNGSLLHKFDMGYLVKNCLWIRVSLDGGTPELHRKTHGVDDFGRIVENVRELIEKRDEHNPGCTVGVGYLTGRGTDNLGDMVDFVRVAVGLGVDYAQFRPFLVNSKGDFSDFTPIDWEPFLKMSTHRTKVLCSKHKYDSMAYGMVERKYGKCYGHQFATALCATGDMTICCHTRGLDWATLGNIRKNTVEEIWNSERRKQAVEKIDLNKCPLLCRCDTFNEILWQINQGKEHVNFL